MLVVVVGGLFYFTRNKPTPVEQPSRESQVSEDAGTVTIQNFSFNPKTLTVKVGTKVTWVNEESMVHTINSATFNSSNLDQGDKFGFTFDTKGIYDYSCGI